MCLEPMFYFTFSTVAAFQLHQYTRITDIMGCEREVRFELRIKNIFSLPSYVQRPIGS